MYLLIKFIEKHIGWILLFGTIIYASVFRFIGYSGLIFLLIGGVIQFRYTVINRLLTRPIGLFVAVMFVYFLLFLLWIILDFSIGSIRMTLIIVFVVNVFFLSYSSNILESKSLVYASVAFLIVMSVFKALNISLNIDGDNGYGFAAYFSTKNSFAIITFCFYIIFLFSTKLHEHVLPKWLRWIGILDFLYLIYSAQARSVYLSTIVFSLILLFWFLIKRNYIIYFTLFIIQVGFTGYLMNYISDPNNVENLGELTETSIEHTGSRLNTGREIIWPFALQKVNESFIIGYGPDITLTKLGYETTLSLHNFYIQTLLQSGIIGFVFLELGLMLLWLYFWRIRYLELTPYFAGFMFAFMIHENFEVNMTQNNVFIGSLFWCIVGMGTSLSLKEQEDEQ